MNAFLEGDVQRSLNAMQEIQDRCRTCCEYRLHEELTGAIKHSCRDRILVNVESDVSEAIHLGTPFSVSPVLLRTVDGQRSVAYGNDDNWAGATLLYRVAPARFGLFSTVTFAFPAFVFLQFQRTSNVSR